MLLRGKPASQFDQSNEINTVICASLEIVIVIVKHIKKQSKKQLSTTNFMNQEDVSLQTKIVQVEVCMYVCMYVCLLTSKLPHQSWYKIEV